MIAADRLRATSTAPGDELADDMLLAGLATGDPKTARAFVNRFQRTVYGVALTTIGDPDLAEDIAQQAFEHAWRHAGVYDPRRGSVRAWLTAITHNLAVDAVRIRTLVPIQDQDLQPLLRPVDDDPQEHALAADTVRELRTMLASLPAEQARAVVLAAIYGLTAGQIAELDAIPLGTAKARIRAGMIKLQAASHRRGSGG